MSAAAGMSTMS